MIRLSILSRLSLACLLAAVMASNAHAETELEASNRILKEVSERVVNQYRTTAPNVAPLPKPATTISPDEVARRLSAQRVPTQAGGQTTDLLVFVSFSMPRESLLRIVEQSEKTGAKLVFRGMTGDKLTDMSRRVADILGTHHVEALIHPPAFTQFKVNQVPALVMAQANAGEQIENGCAQPGRYVKVTGDVSQDYALEYIERTSPQWSAAARLFGDKLKGGWQ